jgi:beta-ribofuranosylaminobenzene 5'-phosphate synthase
MKVTVTAFARLHFCFLNLSEDLGSVYGSIGVGLDQPRMLLTASTDDGFSANGPDAGRVERCAAKLSTHCGREWNARLEVQEAIDTHSGLGSGTQAALATGAALARLHGIGMGTRELAAAMGRGLRSGVGIATFDSGGFIVDGGHPSLKLDEPVRPSDVVLRQDFPEDWRFLLLLPKTDPGLSGTNEAKAFMDLGSTKAITDAICRTVMLQLLPGLAERDIAKFGQALTEVDVQTGRFFHQAQGGVYREGTAREAVGVMLSAGAYGAGQSSWGPCLYALVDDSNEDAVRQAAELFLVKKGRRGRVLVARVRNTGAEVLVE